MTYDDARIRLAEWLDRHATASADQPHDGYDDLKAVLPRGSDPRWTKVFIALHFWDGWIDASNHDWRYYEPILKSDWPTLARELASDLRADREVSNPFILNRFDLRSKVKS
jgi:hypothetical protein